MLAFGRSLWCSQTAAVHPNQVMVIQNTTSKSFSGEKQPTQPAGLVPANDRSRDGRDIMEQLAKTNGNCIGAHLPVHHG